MDILIDKDAIKWIHSDAESIEPVKIDSLIQPLDDF
jgi:hypothetical protein